MRPPTAPQAGPGLPAYCSTPNFHSHYHVQLQKKNQSRASAPPLLPLLSSVCATMPQLSDTTAWNMPTQLPDHTYHIPSTTSKKKKKRTCSVQAAPTILPFTHQHLQLLLLPSTPSSASVCRLPQLACFQVAPHSRAAPDLPLPTVRWHSTVTAA